VHEKTVNFRTKSFFFYSKKEIPMF